MPGVRRTVPNNDGVGHCVACFTEGVQGLTACAVCVLCEEGGRGGDGVGVSVDVRGGEEGGVGAGAGP